MTKQILKIKFKNNEFYSRKYMNSAEVLIITHAPFILLAILGIISLRTARKELESINKKLRRQQWTL